MMARRDSGASAPTRQRCASARAHSRHSGTGRDADAGEEGFGRFDGHRLWLGHFQGRTRCREVRPLVVGGEQPVVADALETRGQHVAQEAADELGGWQRDRALAPGALVPCPDSHLIMVTAKDAVDRNLNVTSRKLSLQRLRKPPAYIRDVAAIHSLGRPLALMDRNPTFPSAERLPSTREAETGEAPNGALVSLPWAPSEFGEFRQNCDSHSTFSRKPSKW